MTSTQTLKIVNAILRWPGEPKKYKFKDHQVIEVMRSLNGVPKPEEMAEIIAFHTKQGKGYNYPECCINNFIQLSLGGITAAAYYDLIGHGNPGIEIQEGPESRIYCDKCFKNYNAKINIPAPVLNGRNRVS